jgi:uncharacterized protein YbbK (DUF523 family)
MIKHLLIFGLISVIIISGCIQEGINISDLKKEIDNYVGKNITVNGKLSFACPSMPGASFPKDCIAEICDNECKNGLDLHFDNSTSGIREMLNKYYEESFQKKMDISVTGLLVKNKCPPNDNACIVTYFIQVYNAKVISS